MVSVPDLSFDDSGRTNRAIIITNAGEMQRAVAAWTAEAAGRTMSALTSLNVAITEAVAELFTSLTPDGTATRIWWIALLLMIVILRILHHAGGAGRALREKLQDFCEHVIELANETIANRETAGDRR